MSDNPKLIQWAEIEPVCILRLLWQKAWMILLAALTGAMLASMVLSVLTNRTYTSTATFVVTPRAATAVYYTNTSTASDVAEIYSQLLQSSAMSQTIHEVLPDIKGSLSATQLGETNLIRVRATSDSPKDALLIIRAVVDNYAELSDYVSSTAVLSVLDTPSVTAISTRTYNTRHIELLAALGGAGGMALLLTWMCVASGTVHNTLGAKNNLDARIISSVPHERSKEKPRRKKGRRLHRNLNISSPAISFPFVESIHRISAKFEHERSKGRQVFLFSSVSEGEGKSTLAANTALSLCERRHKVLFVDLDLRRPVQSEFLGATLNEGSRDLGSLLENGISPAAILDCALTDPRTGLDSLLSAHSYADRIELIASPLLEQVLSLARSHYDYIIIDSPPLGWFSDGEQLSDLSDASVLVVRQNVVPAPEINDAIDALRSGRAEFLGCILNDMRHLHPHLSSYGYGYRYGYSKYGKYGKYGTSHAVGKKSD